MFRHIGIVVKDIDKQLYFYKDLIGLEILYHQVESGTFLEKILSINDVKIEIYKLGIDGKTIVELLNYFRHNQNDSYKNISDFGITHFAISVFDLDKIYNNLLLSGVEFLSEPQINESKTHKVCFCKDFENNLIELVEEL